MLLSAIVQRFNNALAGELYSYSECVDFFDKVIDEINSELNTIFPVFSELSDTAIEYTHIPDKYLRQVLIPGAAWFFYTMDEEGINSASQYQQDYLKGLYYMKRDYSSQIPEEYEAPASQGSIDFVVEADTGERGMELDGSFFKL